MAAQPCLRTRHSRDSSCPLRHPTAVLQLGEPRFVGRHLVPATGALSISEPSGRQRLQVE
eukprot:3373004-Prymnesium_polylepis.1